MKYNIDLLNWKQIPNTTYKKNHLMFKVRDYNLPFWKFFPHLNGYMIY
jgi:hypothetical protein